MAVPGYSIEEAWYQLWAWLTGNGANSPATVAPSMGLTPSTTSTLSTVAGSASSQTALAANTSAKARMFVNDQTAGSTNNAYLAYAATATTSAYTVKIPANGFYETPRPIVYTGVVSVIFDSAAGNLRVTELA